VRSRGGLLLEPAKNGDFSASSRSRGVILWSENHRNLLKPSSDYNQKGKFLRFFAHLLVFGCQYSISPTRERTRTPKRYSAIWSTGSLQLTSPLPIVMRLMKLKR